MNNGIENGRIEIGEIGELDNGGFETNDSGIENGRMIGEIGDIDTDGFEMHDCGIENGRFDSGEIGARDNGGFEMSDSGVENGRAASSCRVFRSRPAALHTLGCHSWGECTRSSVLCGVCRGVLRSNSSLPSAGFC